MKLQSRTLTNRGRGFLAAALGVTLTAVLLGEKDLIAVALLLAIVPIVGMLSVTGARMRLAASREIYPPLASIGQQVHIGLTIDNLASSPSRMLLLEELVPYQAGGHRRFTLEHLAPGGRAPFSYALSIEQRGIYPIGPLRVHTSDPFGMATLQRTFSSTARITVTPPIVPLGSVVAAGSWGGNADHTRAAPRSVLRGEPDAVVRQYNTGDDMRKIHWRASARAGELMVRREIQPRNTAATVLLDSRASAHRHTGDNSSFEWAVTAAASICSHLNQLGYHVTFATSRGEPVNTSIEHILTELAGVRTTTQRHLLTDAPQRDESGLIVAVTGALSDPDLATLRRLRPPTGLGLAIMLDADTWNITPPTSDHIPTGANQLAALGWRTAIARNGLEVPQVWNQLDRRGHRIAATQGGAR